MEVRVEARKGIVMEGRVGAINWDGSEGRGS